MGLRLHVSTDLKDIWILCPGKAWVYTSNAVQSSVTDALVIRSRGNVKVGVTCELSLAFFAFACSEVEVHGMCWTNKCKFRLYQSSLKVNYILKWTGSHLKFIILNLELCPEHHGIQETQLEWWREANTLIGSLNTMWINTLFLSLSMSHCFYLCLLSF